MPDPIRVYISCSAVERTPAEVLAFTIREHASRECEIYFTYEHVPKMQWPTTREARPRTNFSYHRFCVPQLCGYKGRAISMDSDMLVFGDIAEIFDAPMADGVNVLSACPIGRPHQNSSVMVLDCERVPWLIEEMLVRINSGRYTYGDIMRLEKIGVKWAPVDHQWNCLDVWTPQTKLIHYTDMGRQPFLPGKENAHPFGHLWFSARDRMLAANKAGQPS